MNGMLLIDKPAGMSSTAVDNKIKYHLAQLLGVTQRRAPKIGHAGTLDPFATGLQIVGVGSATKELHYLEHAKKEYIAEIKLGFSTTTDDFTGEPFSGTSAQISELTESEILVALESFKGKFLQRPCSVSAKKIDGKRAYKSVLAGNEVSLEPIEVEAFKLKLVEGSSILREPNEINLQICAEVSKGTFIRAIARDLGEKLGVGGHLTALKRTAIGEDFKLENCLTLEEILNTRTVDDFKSLLVKNLSGTTLAFGNFDGVHKGHQKLIRETVRIAKKTKTKPVVVVIDDERQFPLTTVEVRTKYIRNLAINDVVVLKLKDVVDQTYEYFLTNITKRFNIKNLVVTPGIAFGKDKLGTLDKLQEITTPKLIVVPFIEDDHNINQKVSSSTVRELIDEGKIEEANELLGRSYKLTGTVKRGFGRGHKMGFPTANVTDIETQIPADGVYAGAITFDKERHPAMISVGSNPTFNNTDRTVEVNIPGRNDFELYDKVVTIAFDKKLRDMIKFDSVDELIKTLKNDAANVLA